jgi:hypothetical protein
MPAKSFSVTLRNAACFPGSSSINAMKTLHVLTTFAAVAACALLPFALEITLSIAFAACFVGIALADYSRTASIRMPGTARLSVARSAERFGLAA